MTSDRARAYARVTMTLEDMGPAKLLAREQSCIRHAVDTLLFCAELSRSPSGRDAFAEMAALRDHLVESGRWTSERADRLLDDVWACGPGLAEAVPAAA
jgi:hypothetical protein